MQFFSDFTLRVPSTDEFAGCSAWSPLVQAPPLRLDGEVLPLQNTNSKRRAYIPKMNSSPKEEISHTKFSSPSRRAFLQGLLVSGLVCASGPLAMNPGLLRG